MATSVKVPQELKDAFIKASQDQQKFDTGIIKNYSEIDMKIRLESVLWKFTKITNSKIRM